MKDGELKLELFRKEVLYENYTVDAMYEALARLGIKINVTVEELLNTKSKYYETCRLSVL